MVRLHPLPSFVYVLNLSRLDGLRALTAALYSAILSSVMVTVWVKEVPEFSKELYSCRSREEAAMADRQTGGATL